MSEQLSLRDRRRALRWSQERLARKVDCSAAYMGRIERGVHVPSAKLAERIERVLRRAERKAGGPVT